MDFKDSLLEFFDNKIVDTDFFGFEVMMLWETPIMEKSAEFICHNKGDILEIGFGMGICSDYIHAQGVNSHTIIEIHPQVIEKLKIWAEDKSNVTIIEGDWNDAEGLSSYDGIFIDTFRDDNWSNFKDFALSKIKEGGKITYWNGFEEEKNEHSFDNISFEQIPIKPNNKYTKASTYYMPKVEL